MGSNPQSSTTPMLEGGNSNTTTLSIEVNNPPKDTKPTTEALGQFHATILSTYDLSVREPPSFVSLTLCNQTAQTGPPVQRHKDRNSFKFGANARSAGGSRSSNEVTIKAPLSDLYNGVVKVHLVYVNNPEQNLIAEYALNQLTIGDPTWLILRLESSSGGDGKKKKDDWDVPPTVRLQMTLTGPYRAEVAALVSLAQSWFRLMDNLEDQCKAIIAKFQPFTFDPKYFLLPTVPLVAIVIVSAPVLIGFLLAILPVLLPLFAILISAIAFLAVFGGFLFCSTSTGRDLLSGTFRPVAHSLLSSKAGQKLVYETGPRPTPVHVARAILPAENNMWGRLITSLAIDLVGSSSYLVPIVGEITDVVWAPIQTILIMAMFDTLSPNLKYISFVEEILPLTDIIPTATLGWLNQFGVPFVLGSVTGGETITAEEAIRKGKEVANNLIAQAQK